MKIWVNRESARGRFRTRRGVQLIGLASGKVQESFGNARMAWISLQAWNRVKTFCQFFWVLFFLSHDCNLSLLPWLRYVYVLECIRSTKNNLYLEIYGDLIWFSCGMISFQIWPNHAILVPISFDLIWFYYASIMSLWFCPKIQSKQIFAIIYQLFDLIQFLINKKSK